MPADIPGYSKVLSFCELPILGRKSRKKPGSSRGTHRAVAGTSLSTATSRRRLRPGRFRIARLISSRTQTRAFNRLSCPPPSSLWLSLRRDPCPGVRCSKYDHRPSCSVSVWRTQGYLSTTSRTTESNQLVATSNLQGDRRDGQRLRAAPKGPFRTAPRRPSLFRKLEMIWKFAGKYPCPKGLKPTEPQATGS